MDEEQVMQVVEQFEPYRRSLTIGGLMTALAKAQLEIEPARKNKQNPDKHSKYADLSQIIECTTVLNKHGIAVLQFPDAQGSCVSVTTMLALGDEWIDSTLHLVSMKVVKGGGHEMQMDPQGVGSAITYARRYALQSIIGIPSEDDDGEKATKQYRDIQQEQRARAEEQRQQVIERRILEEQTKAKSMGVGGSAVELELRGLAGEANRYKRLEVFARLKKDMEQFGEQGAVRYYEILKGVGVEHSNQFKSFSEAIRAGTAMEAYIKQNLEMRDREEAALMEQRDAAVVEG